MRAVGSWACRSADPRATGQRPSTSTIGARIVVAADGLHSVVARRLHLTRAARWPRRVAFVTHFAGVAEMGERGRDARRARRIYRTRRRRSRRNERRARRASAARPRRGRRPCGISRGLDRAPPSPGQPDAPRAAHLAGPRDGPIRSPCCSRAWAPGAALVGDAADFYDPFTGEGIYAALRGSELLAPYLIAALQARTHGEMDAALAAYDRCRRTEFRGKWIVERIIAAAIASPFVIERVARSLARHPGDGRPAGRGHR